MLRFGRSYITVSEIAQQFFCEYKLHMAIIEGKVETPSMEVGIVIHDEVFKGKSVDATEFLDIVRNNPVVIATLPLVVGIGDVVIVGIPDAVLFINGIAKAVIELKTSNKWLEQGFRDENVQHNCTAYLIIAGPRRRSPYRIIKSEDLCVRVYGRASTRRLLIM
jgi:Type I restriction enzyme R protein N terminus (HSDR_N).